MKHWLLSRLYQEIAPARSGRSSRLPGKAQRVSFVHLRGMVAMTAAALTWSPHAAVAQTDANAFAWRTEGMVQVVQGFTELGPVFGNAHVKARNIEARLDIYARCEQAACAGTNLVLKPRLRLYHLNDAGLSLAEPKTAFFTEAYVGGDIGTASNWSIGKRYMAWGPGLLFSPTNRLFPDNGSSQPRREPGGKFSASITQNLSSAWTVTGLVADPYALTDDGTRRHDVYAALRFEARNNAENPLTAGVLLGGGGGLAPHLGVYAQKSLGDAWTIGTEISGSSGYARQARAGASVLSADRREMMADALVNLRYGLASGGELGIEYIYNGFHLSDAEYANPLLSIQPAGGEWQSRNFLRHPLPGRRYLVLQGSWPSLFDHKRWSAMLRSVNELDRKAGLEFLELSYSPTDSVTGFLGLTRTRGRSGSIFSGALSREFYIAMQVYF